MEGVRRPVGLVARARSFSAVLEKSGKVAGATDGDQAVMYAFQSSPAKEARGCLDALTRRSSDETWGAGWDVPGNGNRLE